MLWILLGIGIIILSYKDKTITVVIFINLINIAMTDYEHFICNIHAQNILRIVDDLNDLEQEYKRELVPSYEFREIKQHADEAIKQLYKHLFNT